jgi:hypothetical protein
MDKSHITLQTQALKQNLKPMHGALDVPHAKLMLDKKRTRRQVKAVSRSSLTLISIVAKLLV